MPKLTKLFRTLFLSAPALVNVASLLLLLMAVYAVFGIQAFHNVRGSVEDILAGRGEDLEFVNKWSNFETFGIALLTLFRCATGESWNGIMHDCYRVSAPVAVTFFLSFAVLCAVFMLNLLVAVILENFSDVTEEFESPLKVKDLKGFVEAWADFDLRDGPRPTYTCRTRDLAALLMAVDQPLGLRGTRVDRAAVLRHVRGLGIPDHGGVVHMHAVLYACAYRVCGAGLADKDHEVHVRSRALRAFPSLQVLHQERPTSGDISTFYAASYVQAAWRGFESREGAGNEHR